MNYGRQIRFADDLASSIDRFHEEQMGGMLKTSNFRVSIAIDLMNNEHVDDNGYKKVDSFNPWRP